MLRFQNLRYFTAVVRHGSMREAAEHVNVAQSALSRQMSNLEYEVGAKLFQRLSRGIKLTPAGERLMEFCRVLDQQLRELDNDIKSIEVGWSGTVVIFAPETIVQDFLPATISLFTQLHPKVSFDVRISSNQRIIAAVAAGGAHLGLAGAQLSPTVPNVNVETLFSVPDPFVALVSRDHPLAAASSVMVSEVLNYPYATMWRDSQGRTLIDSTIARSQKGYTPALETNSIKLLVEFVSNSLGVTILPIRAARSAVESGNVIAVPISDAMLSSTKLHVMGNAADPLPDYAAGFVEFLKERMLQFAP